MKMILVKLHSIVTQNTLYFPCRYLAILEFSYWRLFLPRHIQIVPMQTSRHPASCTRCSFKPDIDISTIAEVIKGKSDQECAWGWKGRVLRPALITFSLDNFFNFRDFNIWFERPSYPAHRISITLLYHVATWTWYWWNNIPSHAKIPYICTDNTWTYLHFHIGDILSPDVSR